MSSINPPSLPDRVIDFLGLLPSSLFIFGSSALVVHGLIKTIFTNSYLFIKIGTVLLSISFILFASSYIWWSLKVISYKFMYPINNLGKKFYLVWIDQTGYLVDCLENKKIEAEVSWISSWYTASDLDFFGYKSSFSTEKEAVSGLPIEKQLSHILKKHYKITNWRWSNPIHTRGALGS